MMPSLFVSHGSPELILKGGGWAEALRETGKGLKKLNPKLVLVISAHWLTEGVRIECSKSHRTLHDFYGFSKELYELEYPAKGDPELCKEIARTLEGKCVEGRGLDHGAWAVLWHLFPDADVPVSQLSIDARRSLEEHLELGRKLRDFREEVVILGSGGAVHNLRDAIFNPGDPPCWAVEFKERLKRMVLEKDIPSLLDYRDELGRLAHPTEEHLLPLFYFLGSLCEEEEVRVLYDGFEFGSVSLLSFASL